MCATRKKWPLNLFMDFLVNVLNRNKSLSSELGGYDEDLQI